MIHDLEDRAFGNSIFELRVLSIMPEPDFIQFPSDIPTHEGFAYCSNESYLESTDVLRISEPREKSEWTDPDIMEFSIFLTPDGQQRFFEFTRDYPRERYIDTAIIINGRIVMTPAIWEAIDTEEIVVTGRFSHAEILYLVGQFQAATVHQS